MNWLAWAAAVAVLSLAAALRAAGESLVRTPRADALHDAADGRQGAGIVAELLEERTRIRPAISLIHATLLVTVALSAAWATGATLSGSRLAMALAMTAAMIVLLGDLWPRSVGRKRPHRIAYRLARLLRLAISIGSRAGDLIEDEEDIVPAPAVANGDHDPSDREEIRMISSVLEFSDAIVREVMVPRTDMVTLGAASTTTEALDLILDCGYSRVPVTGKGTDDIVGMVYAKDLLGRVAASRDPEPVTRISREPYFVPESKPVPDLLREMQSTQIHIAIAVDEFGGTAGLVTIEDLIEELVGEIVDEYDTEAPMVQPLDDGGFLVAARLSVDDLNQVLGADLPDDEWDTVGGLVLGLAGRVPMVGERFEMGEAVLVADRVQGRRVERVLVHRVGNTDR
ncbi:MAG: HlyC/CorC family transporter [Acidimicrobiia bacterium]|nr:HlyC/CorC family transporter [Acidimicrobiia bacterium]